MKRILLFVIVLLLFSCSSKKDSPKLFTPEILSQQLFSIDASKDTILHTLHGSLLRIAAGSFNVSGNIRMEIREAFTPAEILASGMTTESNTRPLRSGGMIYINAFTKGEAVSLVKPISVSIPNPYYDSAMQIFKGVETDSEGINWVDPEPTDSTAQSKKWDEGKLLFTSKCISCHNIFRDLTGPALRNVEERIPDRKNIYDYIHHVPALVNRDPYFRNLRVRFGSMMPAFPALSNENIDAILDYIKNEAKRPGALEEAEKYSDSLRRLQAPLLCDNDTFYIPVPKNNITFLDTTPANPSTADTTPISNKLAKAEDMEGLRGGFNDPNPTSGMYDFEIKTLGWFNVDAYVEGYDGTTNVKLWAQVIVDFEIDLHVYLFCPEKKMLSIGYDKQGNKYFFNKINEAIPLFLSDRAILFAFGSKGDQMYYGISEFKIQKEQTIQVKIKQSTEEEIRKALISKQMDGIDLGIEKKEKVIKRRPCDQQQTGADTTMQKEQ